MKMEKGTLLQERYRIEELIGEGGIRKNCSNQGFERGIRRGCRVCPEVSG